MSIDWFSFFLGFYAACSCGWSIFWLMEDDMTLKGKLVLIPVWFIMWPIILLVATIVAGFGVIKEKAIRRGRA